MAKARSVNAVLIMALVATLWTMSNAQSSSCTSVLISLSPCLNYITGNSSTPSSSCCSQLKSVVSSQPQCLCQVINGNAASSLGININKAQALQLPSACNVQTPSISRCSGASSPSGSPSISSNPSSSSSGGATSPGISTGSKAVPSVDTSEGHVTKVGFALFIALFLIASHA